MEGEEGLPLHPLTEAPNSVLVCEADDDPCDRNGRLVRVECADERAKRKIEVGQLMS